MNQQLITGPLENAVVKDRYVIQRHLDNGEYGHIYKVLDSQNKNLPLVMKITEDCKAFKVEVHIMKKVSKNEVKLHKKDSIPDVIEQGLIMQENENTSRLLAYIIMPRYGFNLDYWFEKLKCKISTVTTMDIGLRLIRFF